MRNFRLRSAAVTAELAWLVGLGILVLPRLGWADDEALGQSVSGFFERAEPNLSQGARALLEGRSDDAIRAFRKAKTQTEDERAIVEYDVGQALLQQGIRETAERDEEQAQDESGIVLDEAAEAFDRAYGLTTNRRLKSAAAQAAGNARAQKGDLPGAVEAFRKAMIADPENRGARKNLASVLRALAAQPPPPPGESDESDESSESDKNEEGSGDAQNSEAASADGRENDEGEQESEDSGQAGEAAKSSEQKNDSNDPTNAASPGKKPPETKSAGERDPRDEEEKNGEHQPGQPTPEEKSQAQARRLLDQMRNREKPLAPLWMQGKSSSRPSPEKDW